MNQWFEDLLYAEDVITCPSCGAYNAYAWQDSNVDPNTRKRVYLEGADGVEQNSAPDIYHIPTASGFEWQCGKCGTNWMPIDSPLNAEVYTHIPREEEDERF